MAPTHKNKTFATFLAAVLGGAGLHRFYLRGNRDPWAWLHLAALALTVIGMLLAPHDNPVAALLISLPLTFSILSGALEALVLGVKPDEKWDATYNPGSGRQSSSNWLLALILVLTLAVGMTGLIFLITRSIDLFLTGGSYG